jgi:NAD(P)-dependent dehydrogenase (short-subunit alcohol dehydrogenase family)
MKALSLAGKFIIVTGGTQGIGAAIALDAAHCGASGICISGRNAASGSAMVAALEKRGSQAFCITADLADVAAAQSIVQGAIARFGRIDGLVNAAGITDRGSIEDTSVVLWDRMFAVNVRAPFILTQALVRHLREDRRPGSIVNIITRSSHGGQPFLTAYSASKGALATLTKNNAHALRFDRIRVNGLNIGWTDTPGEHAIQKRDGKPPDWLARAEPLQPFGRLIRPDDVSFFAVYLLSDAAEMITGALIDFDQNVMGGYD